MTTGTFNDREIADLLGRAVRAEVGPAQRAAFAGRHVLVTGAGGSIGSALARELAGCGPAVLGLLDHSELGLFTIEREIQERWPDVRLVTCLADVAHAPAVTRACAEIAPDVIYHAAAYKHVTMAERAAAATARVNVVGSVCVAEAAKAVGARFVLISTDKAANPKSVMGASKRFAEIGTLAMASSTFRPLVVRFGNVLGSSGSVLQIMRACVREGRPVPITDPDATRYFMTAGEAVALVLQADLLGHAAEILWLDMGDPVRLGDLADRLLALERQKGFTPAGLEVIGLRPGEKLNEVLVDPDLHFERTVDDRILVARDTGRRCLNVAALLRDLRHAVARADDAAALEILVDAVKGFEPSAQARALAA